MAINNSMDTFKVHTLIDITKTGLNKFKTDNRKLINQQTNWNTFQQVISMRANVYFDTKPTITETSVSEFGTAYKGKHKVWSFEFNVEQEGAVTVDALVDDFNLIPVVAGLDSTIDINNNAFRTKGKECINIIFKVVDKDA